jgi:histidinol-phosphate aminotransferase
MLKKVWQRIIIIPGSRNRKFKMIRIPKHILELQPYKAGKPIEELAREKGIKKIVKLASNENPLGPSPRAINAIKSGIFELHRYSDPSSYKLVHALAERTGRKPVEIVAGSGSDSLLQYAITAFTDEDDELLSSEGTFIGWYVNANKYSRKMNLVPLNNYKFDLEKIADNISAKTKIIYLANPNNPTGSIFTKKEFEKFIKRVPDDIIIILDEAYTVYAESDPEYPNGLEYRLPNLIVMRTLSKAYGLAGLRAGYAVGPEELIKNIYKVKLPFEPNSLAQAAAIASLEDDDFIFKTKEINNISLSIMQKTFDEIGLKYIPTSANFFLLLFTSEKAAAVFNEECLNYGLILRHVKAFGIANGIRINSGTVEETKFAMDVIRMVSSSDKKKKKQSSALQ